MMRVTILFDTRFHTVNGKQDSISFAVDSAEKVRNVVWEANKMGNVSDIRVAYHKDGCLRTDYIFCMEMYEGAQLIKRTFCFNNGNSFSDDDLEAIQIMADDWESVINHEAVFKNTKRWSL